MRSNIQQNMFALLEKKHPEQTTKEFCAANGISEATYYYWLKKSKQSTKVAGSSFVPVRIVDYVKNDQSQSMVKNLTTWSPHFKGKFAGVTRAMSISDDGKKLIRGSVTNFSVSGYLDVSFKGYSANDFTGVEKGEFVIVITNGLKSEGRAVNGLNFGNFILLSVDADGSLIRLSSHEILHGLGLDDLYEYDDKGQIQLKPSAKKSQIMAGMGGFDLTGNEWATVAIQMLIKRIETNEERKNDFFQKASEQFKKQWKAYIERHSAR